MDPNRSTSLAVRLAMNKDESKGETSDRDESQKSSSPSRGAEAGVVQTSLESAAVET